VDTADEKNSIPACFGQLDIVFPMQADGLRRTPEDCLACAHKTICLRTAVAGRDGHRIADEKVDRAYTSGTMGFFERWLRKKTIARQKEKNK
jgi:hypothetical protein